MESKDKEKSRDNSQQVIFRRYLWIFDTIKNNPGITREQIEERYYKSELADDLSGISKRNFYRDINAIKRIFNIEITTDNNYGYSVGENYLSTNVNKLLDSYRFINIYQIFKEVDHYIATEQSKSGSEYLLLMLDAIQNRKRVEFTYSKYVDDTPEKRTIEPYFVKEFKSRWYVIARDKKDRQIKTFALERMGKDPNALNPSASFDIPQNITPDNFFKDSYGIFKLSDAKAEEIELSFKPLKGKFIKSQPLHASQTIIIDNDTELRIKLQLQITHDFIMELLSHGSEVKVIAPESFRDTLIEEYNNTLNQYK
jgi:predicted DNA-binding transcriptional regulator YafY